MEARNRHERPFIFDGNPIKITSIFPLLYVITMFPKGWTSIQDMEKENIPEKYKDSNLNFPYDENTAERPLEPQDLEQTLLRTTWMLKNLENVNFRHAIMVQSNSQIFEDKPGPSEFEFPAETAESRRSRGRPEPTDTPSDME
jgi:hypothetical protein